MELEKKTHEQDKEESARRAEALAKEIMKLPQKFQDRIAGAVSFAQLATAEKAG